MLHNNETDFTTPSPNGLRRVPNMVKEFHWFGLSQIEHLRRKAHRTNDCFCISVTILDDSAYQSTDMMEGCYTDLEPTDFNDKQLILPILERSLATVGLLNHFGIVVNRTLVVPFLLWAMPVLDQTVARLPLI